MATYLRVLDDVTYETTEYGDPDDRWSRDSTAEYHHISGIQIVGEKDRWDLCVPFEVDPDRSYSLLYVIYNTGDSFGRDDGRINLIDLYEDQEVAFANAARIDTHARQYDKTRWGSARAEMKEPYSVELLTNEGESCMVHTPWNGYFERLQYTEVLGVRVQTQHRLYH